MKRKALSVFLVLCLMSSMCSFALAANENARIADAVLDEVLERYTTDYSISDAVATVVDKSVELDGSTTYEIHGVSFLISCRVICKKTRVRVVILILRKGRSI